MLNFSVLNFFICILEYSNLLYKDVVRIKCIYR